MGALGKDQATPAQAPLKTKRDWALPDLYIPSPFALLVPRLGLFGASASVASHAPRARTGGGQTGPLNHDPHTTVSGGYVRALTAASKQAAVGFESHGQPLVVVGSAQPGNSEQTGRSEGVDQ